MFKTVCVLALCLTAAELVWAPAHAQVHQFPFQPTAGAQWDVAERRVRSRGSEGPSSDLQTGLEATVTFIEETDEGYVFEWELLHISDGNVTIEAGSLDPNFLIGAPIRYVADIDGSPMRIANADEIVAQVLDIASADQPSGGGPEMVRQIFTNTDPATLAQVVLSTMATIGSCQHIQVNADEPEQLQGMQPGLGGSPPILVNGSIELERAGSAGEPAIVVIRQSLDPDSATASMMALMESAAVASGQAPPAAQLSPFERDTTITCSIDVETGDARSVVSEMDVRIGEARQSDRREISFLRR